MTPDHIVIELRGHVPSKKNNLRPRKGGGIMNDNKEVHALIDRLSMQVPGRVRDLNLESPDIHFHFFYQRANWDRDNACTTLLDIMVKYGVLKDDNVARCNGTITIHPAERAEEDSVKIILFPRVETTPSPRYVKPPRRKSLAPIPVILNDKTTPDEDDLPDLLEGVEWGD